MGSINTCMSQHIRRRNTSGGEYSKIIPLITMFHEQERKKKQYPENKRDSCTTEPGV